MKRIRSSALAAVVVVFAATLTVVGAGPAQAAPCISRACPDLDQAIWYLRGGQVHRMNSDGSGDVAVTALSRPVWNFTVSGSRTRLVVNHEGSIWTLMTDGTGYHKLIGFDYQARPPLSLSPDGLRFAFHDMYRLDVIGVDGTGRYTVARGPVWNVAWSPDGTKVAFDRNDGTRYDVWVVTADGKFETKITIGGARNPTWSPDGTRIAYEAPSTSGAEQIAWTAVDQFFPHAVTAVAAPAEAMDPTWSPDGDWIAYSTRPSAESLPDGVRKIRVDGTVDTLVTDRGDHPDWGVPLR